MNRKESLECLVKNYFNEEDNLKKIQYFEELFNSLTLDWFNRLLRVRSQGRIWKVEERDLEEIKDDFFLKFLSDKGFKVTHISKASFHTWSSLVIYNLYIDRLRRNFTKNKFIYNQIHPATLNCCRTILPEFYSMELKAKYSFEFCEIIETGINSIIGLEKRIIFLLYVIFGIELKDISEVFNKKLNTVRSNYRSARLEFLKVVHKNNIMDFFWIGEYLNNFNFEEFLRFQVKLMKSGSQKELLNLFFYSDKNLTQISEFLNIPKIVIHSRIKAGILNLLKSSRITTRLKELTYIYNSKNDLCVIWKKILSLTFSSNSAA